MSKTKKKPAHSVVWFEVAADQPERAREFYGKLFGWTINPLPGTPARVTEYWHIATGGDEDAPDGGLMKRLHPGQSITNYISVPSVTRFMDKVKKLGGEVCVPRTAVPQMGYFAVCQDTEGNVFALWEMNDNAK